MFKTNDLQNIIYTSMGDDINVSIINFHLFVPNLTPSVETQLLLMKLLKTFMFSLMNIIQKDE